MQRCLHGLDRVLDTDFQWLICTGTKLSIDFKSSNFNLQYRELRSTLIALPQGLDPGLQHRCAAPVEDLVPVFRHSQMSIHSSV